MKKLLTILTGVLLIDCAYSQVGINTENPQQLFHTDGKSSTATTNPITGAPSVAQQVDDVVITNQGRVGIGTISPSESLDVNGKARIRNTELLTSSTVSPIYVDENGLVGKVNISPASPQTTFASSTSTTDITTDFNAGNIIQVPIIAANFGLNTLNTTVNNNRLTINSTGVYQLTSSLNIFLDTTAIDSRVYVAYNIQRSTNNGSTWASISGARPIFTTPASGGFNYNIVLPTVLQSLNQGDLLRLVIYRTRGGNGNLQGVEVASAIIQQSVDHGTKTYTLSISKF